MILTTAGLVYGTVATWRRRWYAADPTRRRRLDRPVVSVGNLSTGGAGKTPIVACLARLLAARGARPAILSRGYARTRPDRGVTIVSDGAAVLAPLERAGDEPLMLANSLPGIAVVVAADRHAAGVVAERRLGATVHLLDDGFQHLALARDVDLLVAGPEDLSDRVLPAGRLREPLQAAAAADAVLVNGSDPGAAERVRAALDVPAAFRVDRALGAPRWIDGGGPADIGAGDGVVAVAGIARPERFFADLAAAGWRIAERLVFPDHHPYGDADVDRIRRAVRDAPAGVVLTTEKDAVRLAPCRRDGLRIAAVPLAAAVEDGFADWLLARLEHRGPVVANGATPASRQ